MDIKKKLNIIWTCLLGLIFSSVSAFSQMSDHQGHEDSQHLKSKWMIHGNAFLVQSFGEGPRGRNQFAVPNMLMADKGSTFKEKHFVNVNLMLTFEKWTFPKRGYPELLQIGEDDKSGNPYIDGQHPHSSPVMGLTISDTITLSGKDHLKIFFSPRGQSTDGPIAFMHRVTGMSNPDAPLGHHIGQDVSHITSTVLGSSLKLSRSTFEASVFNGTEPEPTEVDLPIDKINSYGGRFIYEFSDNFYAMASAAYVKEPEHDDPTLEKIYRYSGSFYYNGKFSEGVLFHNAFIFGLVNFYDHISKLRSFGNEFLLHSQDSPHNIWGRMEVLERGAEQLQISGRDDVKWVQSLTLGYTYDLLKLQYGKIGIGGSMTKNFVPAEFENSYGGDPFAGKVFIQLSGMKMGNF